MRGPRHTSGLRFHVGSSSVDSAPCRAENPAPMRTFKTTRVFVPAAQPKSPPPPPRKKATSPVLPKLSVPGDTATAAPAPKPKPPAQARPPEPPPNPGPEPTPPGNDYLLEIERAAIVDLQKLGRTVEVRFVVTQGPHAGSMARGQFPVSGMGLPVLSEAALGARLDFSAPEHALGLVGKSVVADVVQPSNRLSLVRNIRAAQR